MVTSVGNNSVQPSAASYSYTSDQLLAGPLQIEVDTVTITGAAALKRGTVLGRVTLGAVTSAAKSGGNTGNGTCVLDVTTPKIAGAVAGVYTLRCTVAGANAATFRLADPSGRVLGDYAFNGSGANVLIANQIKAVITDGSTDFVVGDGFDITIANSAASVPAIYKKAVKTAFDGSAVPCRVLIDDVDATLADKTGSAYRQAELNFNRLIYDASFSATDIRVAFRDTSLFIHVPAATNTDPT